jgi:hypothetical protein
VFIHIGTVDKQAPNRQVALRCPACRREGTFDVLAQDVRVLLKSGDGMVTLGQRACPNRECRAHVFVVLDMQGTLAASYPAETIDFDATDLPANVVEAFEEAIKCHSQACYVAAAIMVRKTLEEVCHERGAQGGNLKERVKALGKTVVLPQEMLNGLDDLRLLGNDAAHIESQVFSQVGQEEVEVAIDVTKEILKAVY